MRLYFFHRVSFPGRGHHPFFFYIIIVVNNSNYSSCKFIYRMIYA